MHAHTHVRTHARTRAVEYYNYYLSLHIPPFAFIVSSVQRDKFERVKRLLVVLINTEFVISLFSHTVFFFTTLKIFAIV